MIGKRASRVWHLFMQIPLFAIFTIALAPLSAQCQQTTVRDLGPAKHPKGVQHSTVTDGLEAPEGSAERFQAEICTVLPGAEQEKCMLQKRDKPKRAQAIPEGWKATEPLYPLSPEGDESESGSAHSLCRERWKNDYVMREYCDKRQNAARARRGY